MRTKPAPMTADTAREFIAEMRAGTSPDAAQHLLTIALGKYGNLSDEARAIYATEIANYEAETKAKQCTS